MKKILIALLLCLSTVGTIAQQSVSTTIVVENEGATQGRVRRLDCTGAGITCSVTGGEATLNVSGGGGGGGNFAEVTVTWDYADPDGYQTQWELVPGFEPNFNILASDVAWSPTLEKFALVGGDAISTSFYTSSDGLSFTPLNTGNNGFFTAVEWSPSLAQFCAIRQSVTANGAARSSNGIDWTFATTAQANQWQDLVWSPSLSLFVAVSTDGANRVMTSSDCITWATQSASAANLWRAVTWSPSLSLFVAVSADGANQVMTSPNGTAWTNRTPPTRQWHDVTWSPELGIFVAVGEGIGSPFDEVMYSSDGINWTGVDADPNSNGDYIGVGWAAEIGLFVASGPNSTEGHHVIVSKDGITWIKRPILRGSRDTSSTDLVYSSTLNRFVAAGINSNFLVSSPPPVGLVYTATITGQAWVTSSSQIICNAFATSADGQTVETYPVANLQAVASNRVVGTGFDLSITNPHGAVGTFRFHCTGS